MHIICQILFYFTYPIAKGVPGELEATLNSQPMALEYLMPAMMNLYVGTYKAS